MIADKLAAAAAIDAFLRAIGRDPERDPELAGTATRVADAFVDDLCEGYGVDVDRLLEDNVLEGGTGFVVLRDIAVTTTCPHHLMPAVGSATVAFEPDGRIVGLGALARVVDAFARRLALQEQIGEAVVAALVAHLRPRWAGCRLVLQHGCMVARGERKHAALAETIALGGTADDARRALALRVLGVGT